MKNTASTVIGNKLIICNSAVKWRDEEVKEARVRREGYAKYTSNKTTAGWEGYATARKKVIEMVEEKNKKGLSKYVFYNRNEDFDGGMMKHRLFG